MNTTVEITDAVLHAACKVYDFAPVGHVPVQGYPVDLDPGHREGWSDEDCFELAAKVVDGETWPEAGPLGFAAGYASPGWRFLRDLCEKVAADHIGTDWFDAFSYDEAREHLEQVAEERARLQTWPHALVCVADIGVDESTEDAAVHLGDCAGEEGCHPLSGLAWALLGYAGYLVLREVFAPVIDTKPRS